MAYHVVTRAVLAFAMLGAPGAAAQGTTPPSDSTHLAANLVSDARQDTWVRTTSSTAATLRKPIALDLQHVRLQDALRAIGQAANLVIQFGPDVLSSSARVSLHVTGMTVAEALTTAVDGSGLVAYVSLGGDAVLVARAPHADADHSDKRVQDGRITGRVVDADLHTGIPSAAVVITGTTIGTSTTDSGTFTLRTPPDAKTLTVRRIGYIAQTVSLVTGKTDYTVALQKDVLRLEAQVVTGVATTVASQNAANAVAVLNTQDVNQVPAPTMETSLEGKIPGALVENHNGGAPGGGLQIEVRGITSINGNALPLYVVDGIIMDNETVSADDNAINQAGGGVISTGQTAGGAPSPQDNGINRISDINPDDIESIEVLKGASASAIYGSKASAGVVIITTKRGTSGKAKWTVANQVGHFSLENEFPIRTFGTLQSAQGWYVNDVTGDTAATAVAADNAYIAGLYAGPQNLQTQLFSNPQAAYQSNVSVSGTSGSTQYYLSGLSKYDNGIMYNTGYNKQSIRSNITQQVTSNLSVSANLNYIHDVTRRGITGNDNIGISPYNVFSYTPGFLALNKRNADGSWPVNPFGQANPFADAAEIATPQQTSRFIGGGTANWTPWKTEHQSLQLNLVGGADLASLQDLLYAPPDLQVEQRVPSGLPGTSVSSVAQLNYFNYAINLVHHYTGLSWLDATTSIGFERDRRSLTNPVTVGSNLLAGVNAPTVGTVQSNFFYRTEQLDQSLYAQEQIITLASRLTVTGGVTAERSTNDGDINTFYYYPRYSASYRVPEPVNGVDEIKLRVAYGQSGNLPSYGARYSPLSPTLIAGANAIGGSALLGDPNITPESEQEIETGIDATLFKSRAQFSATIYQKRLTSLLLQAGVAPSHGYSALFVNGGEFTNQGIELSLQDTPLQLRNGFVWVNTTSFYRNYSVVNALPVPSFAVNEKGLAGTDFLAPGRSVSEVVNPNLTGSNGEPVQIGDALPGFTMSFGNEFTWKGFRVYGLLDWNRGGNEGDATDAYYDFGPHLYADSAASAARLAQFGAGFLPYLQPASFLKVRQVIVSYNLPATLIRRIGAGRLTNARISISGYNLWGIYNYPGLDPEVTSLGTQAIPSAREVTPYPPARSYYLGLDLGF